MVNPSVAIWSRQTAKASTLYLSTKWAQVIASRFQLATDLGYLPHIRLNSAIAVSASLMRSSGE